MLGGAIVDLSCRNSYGARGKVIGPATTEAQMGKGLKMKFEGAHSSIELDVVRMASIVFPELDSTMPDSRKPALSETASSAPGGAVYTDVERAGIDGRRS